MSTILVGGMGVQIKFPIITGFYCSFNRLAEILCEKIYVNASLFKHFVT